MRLVGLDALRGIAASLVLAQHLLVTLGIALPLDLGKLGVAVFFLISGFVIPFSINHGRLAFAIGRAFRLLPALWLSIALCIALGAKVGVGQLLTNMFMVSRFANFPYISEPYWTLNWELIFYVIMAAFIPRDPKRLGLLSLGISALASVTYAPFSFLSLMLCGAMLRCALLEKSDQAWRWLRPSLVALVGVWALWWRTGATDLGFLGSIALAIPVFILLWDKLHHPVLTWLGAISYSLYLFHLPILQALPPMHPLATVSLGVLLPVAVAAVVYRWFERPMIALGRVAISRIAGTPSWEPYNPHPMRSEQRPW